MREWETGPPLREGGVRCGKCVCDLAVHVRARGRHGAARISTIQRCCRRLGWVVNVRVVSTLRGRRRGSLAALRSGVHGLGGPRSFVKAERDAREVRRRHKPQCLWAGLD